MIKRFNVCLILIYSISLSARGQIKGVVTDESNNAPIEYATIILKKGGEILDGTISKPDGSFLFLVIPKGTFSIEVSFLGYQTKETEGFKIQKDNLFDLGTIGLQPSQNLLDEVVLQTNTAAIRNKIDRQVYSASEFSTARGGTGIDLIRNLPSVSINGMGEISVRGSSGFVVLLNNKPIQSDIQNLLSQIPANSVKNIEIITSPSAQFDAEGKAGIINILTLKNALQGDYFHVNTLLGAPSVERYENEENVQRYGADITYNTVREKWNFSSGFSFQRNDISGRREGDVYTIIGNKYTRFPSDGERSFDEINYSGRLTADYQFSKKDQFSLGVFAGKRTKERTADILYYANNGISEETDYQLQYFNENLRIRKSDFVIASFDYDHRFENSAQLHTSFLYEYTLLGGPTTNRNLMHPNHSIVYQDEYNTNDNPLFGLRINIDYEFQPISIGTLKIGYQLRNLDHKGDFVYERKNNNTQLFELVPEFSSEVNLKRSIHATYLQYNGQFEKWDFAAGLRLENMERNLSLKDKTGQVNEDYSLGFTKFFPSASINYQLKDRASVGLAYSKRIERTTTFKMNPFPEREHSETLEQGDPNLQPEMIDQVELKFQFKTKKRNLYNTALYFRNIDNLINRVNTVYNDTILNRIYSNVGKAKVLGREMSAEYSFGKRLKILISSNSSYFFIKGSFDNIEVDKKGYVSNYNLNSTYRFSDRSFAQLNFNYLSRRLTAQGEDSQFYSPNLTVSKRFWNDQLTATLQWKNIDMGLMNTNEQRITTQREGEFYTTTNYVYEVDVILLSFSYNFNNRKNTAKFIDSEFGKKEF
ncbi:MAG: outer membrane beta-barrel family protein [Flavobacteriaceae bacterium]|nr:outer membrane beta-barrel family protein [Flavobacteriaceae bacterium]